MRHSLLISSLLILCTTGAVNGQRDQQNDIRSYVTVPSENMLLVVASQPLAPIRFEDTKLLISVDGRELAISYKLHNLGAKPIRYATSVMWTSLGTGGTLSGSGPSSGAIGDKLLMPGEARNEESPGAIIPLSDETREKLKLRGSMRAIVVLMVQSVAFADGSIYRDDATCKSLQSYFEELSDKVERLESLQLGTRAH